MEKAEDFKELSPNLYQTLQKAKTVKNNSDILEDGRKPIINRVQTFSDSHKASEKTLTDHRDKQGKLFFSRVGYLVASIIGGIGLIISYARKGTIAFGRSNGNVYVNQVAEKIDRINSNVGKLSK